MPVSGRWLYFNGGGKNGLPELLPEAEVICANNLNGKSIILSLAKKEEFPFGADVKPIVDFLAVHARKVEVRQ